MTTKEERRERALIEIAFHERTPEEYRQIARKVLAETTTIAELLEHAQRLIQQYSGNNDNE
jgi:hypothetical protein